MPNKAAIVTNERSLNWQELWDEVSAAASFINQHLPSDLPAIVALLMPNSWQHVVSNLAVVHAGHIAMPIDVIYKPLEIEAILGQMAPALLITDQAGLGRWGRSDVPVLNADEFPAQLRGGDYKLLRQPAHEQVASLLFTSGTTGKPKAVPYTHANHIWNIKACSQIWQWDQNDSLLISLRLSHMHGLVMGLSGALYHGNTLYLQDRFNEKDTLNLLASGKISMFTHGPLVYARLLEVDNAKDYDLSKVRLFISGSGPLAPAIWQQFKEVYGSEILEVYGTTESGRIASNLLDERISGGPGPVLPGVEYKFDSKGQVLVRSPGVFPGYWHNTSATRQALTDDGFYKTGDLGEIVNGRLVLKGRIQEKIRRQGYTIYPRDIEWALHKDPRVKEIIVVGLQRPAEANDQLAYFVVGDLSDSDLSDFCRANLPSVWRPDKIFMLERIPRTRTNKPDLNKLRAMIN